MDRLSKNSPFDFVSDDLFIDQILSRLDSLKSILRLGVASKRFHSLCDYPPVLEIQDVLDNVGLIKYLDKFFEARLNNNTSCGNHGFRKLLLCVQNSTTHIPIMDFVTVHLLGWFRKALSLNVQELNLRLEVGYGRYFERPELNLQYSMIPLKNLRVLTLDDIPIALNQSFEDWISTCCVSLEELNLSGVVVIPTNLRIKSSSLKIFTIDGHFRHLGVSSPKLVTLHVTWNCIILNKDEATHLSLEISETPNLEDFLMANWDASYDSLRYGSSSGYINNFPSLKSATVLLPVKAHVSLITADSLGRLLLDISEAKELRISDTILHQIPPDRIMHYATLFSMLNKFHVRIEGDRKYSWPEKTRRIMCFVKNAPSLKTFKLTIENGYYDPPVSENFRESLLIVNTLKLLKLGISRPVLYLEDHKVKIEVVPGDDETLLLEHIIKKAPRDLKFIFLYQR